MAWGMLRTAAVPEVVWALALKQSDGFGRLRPSVLGSSAAVASFALLALALRTLPVGTAYAGWVGVGSLGVAVAAGPDAEGPAVPDRAPRYCHRSLTAQCLRAGTGTGTA